MKTWAKLGVEPSDGSPGTFELLVSAGPKREAGPGVEGGVGTREGASRTVGVGGSDIGARRGRAGGGDMGAGLGRAGGGVSGVEKMPPLVNGIARGLRVGREGKMEEDGWGWGEEKMEEDGLGWGVGGRVNGLEGNWGRGVGSAGTLKGLNKGCEYQYRSYQ